MTQKREKIMQKFFRSSGKFRRNRLAVAGSAIRCQTSLTIPVASGWKERVRERERERERDRAGEREREQQRERERETERERFL